MILVCGLIHIFSDLFVPLELFVGCVNNMEEIIISPSLLEQLPLHSPSYALSCFAFLFDHNEEQGFLSFIVPSCVII